MKTFKKALSIVLGLAMMLSCVAGMQISASAEGTSSFTVTVGNGTAKPGETVEIPVTLSNVVGGYTALGFAIDYDPAVLTLAEKVAVTGNYDGTGDSTTSTFVFEQSENLTDRPYNLIWAYVDDEPNTADGIVATLKFTVNANATAGATTTVAIAANAKSGSMNGNADVDVKYVNGTVTVASACEHTNTTTTENVTLEATCTTVGSKIVTVTCECGEVISTTTVEIPVDPENHTDANGDYFCDECKEMLPNSALNPTPSFNISDKIVTSYYINKSVLDAYDSFYLEFARDKCNSQYNFEDYVEEIRLGVSTEDKLLLYKNKTYYIYPSAVGMYEFSIPYSATIYVINDGEVVGKSETITRTVRQAVDEKYAALTDDRADLKALYADMIKMGGEAQRAFTAPRPDCDLAKLADCDDGFIGAYSEKVTTFDEATGTTNTTGLTFKASINVAETPCISYYFAPGNGYTHSDITITATYESPKLGTVTESVNITDADKVLNYKNKGQYYYYFRKAALYDSNKDVTCTVYYQGTPIITSVDSVESCMNANITNATYTELYYAIATFSTSARVYFKTA